MPTKAAKKGSGAKATKKAPVANKAKTTSETKKEPLDSKKKAFAIISIVLPILYFLISFFFTPPTKTAYYVFDGIAILCGIVSIVLSRIGRSKETKTLATVGLVIGILFTIFIVVDILSAPSMAKLVKNCKRNDDGVTATCEMKNQNQNMNIPVSMPVYFVEEEME